MSRIAIIAAFPGELKPLVGGLSHERRNGVDLWSCRFDEGEWIAACAGAGQQAATKAFAEAEAGGAISLVISTGWAGALTEECLAGQAYTASGVVDSRTGERFRVALWSDECWLVTSPIVADEAEKQRLASTYHAALVDMEAAAIARLALMRGIPFYCIKGVSDGLRDRLPDFNRFIRPNGRFNLLGLILFVLPRPWYWPALTRMGENSKRASTEMARALLELLNQHA